MESILKNWKQVSLATSIELVKYRPTVLIEEIVEVINTCLTDGDEIFEYHVLTILN